ncbi:MAG: hypothetical protein Q4D19_10710 [Lautropia sp.]|nr:hypothetical protein [Lautropia sp.]
MELRSLQPCRPSFGMQMLRAGSALVLSLAVLGGSALIATDAHAAAEKAVSSVKAKKKSGKARAGKAAAAAAAAAAPLAIAAADEQQMKAMSRVNEGASLCEFNQQVHVTASQQYPGYVDLSFKKKRWLMKPVLSSTGALRLEDVAGETLFIQIRNKSMLMNQKNGQRLVDGCVHPRQQASVN